MEYAHTLVNDEIDRIPSLVHLLYGKRFSEDPSLISSSDRVYTYSDYYRYAYLLAKFLGRGGNIAIHAANSPEWLITFVAGMISHRIVMGVYMTNSPEQCCHIVKMGDVDTLVVDSLEIYNEKYANLNPMPRVIVIHPPPELPQPFIKWADVWGEVSPSVREMKLNLDEYQRDDPVLFTFTSGTTGNPKACMLSHKNLLSVYKYSYALVKGGFQHERVLSYLPLSHIGPFECDVVFTLCAHGTVCCAPSDALKGSLLTALTHFRPTTMLGVPRVWEKLHEGYLRREQTFGLGTKILTQAARWSELFVRDHPILGYLPWTVGNYITGTIRAQMGLDQARIFISGSAAISQETYDFFTSIGIDLYQAYGMSETAGVICGGIPEKRGCVGRVYSGDSVKIVDGEIYFKGGPVFSGYYKDPEATRDAFADGYLKTGDLGYLDEEGRIYLTGRRKELMKTSGAENIPYLIIEHSIEHACPKIHNVILIGNRRKYLTCLVSGTADEKEIQEAINTYNEHAFSHAQRVQKFTQINDLSIAGGELTPTFKIRRNYIYEKYAEQIERMYQSEAP